jgi:hypothetical protein
LAGTDWSDNNAGVAWRLKAGQRMTAISNRYMVLMWFPKFGFISNPIVLRMQAENTKRAW